MFGMDESVNPVVTRAGVNDEMLRGNRGPPERIRVVRWIF
jgi:hypothetical protein